MLCWESFAVCICKYFVIYIRFIVGQLVFIKGVYCGYMSCEGYVTDCLPPFGLCRRYHPCHWVSVSNLASLLKYIYLGHISLYAINTGLLFGIVLGLSFNKLYFKRISCLSCFLLLMNL